MLEKINYGNVGIEGYSVKIASRFNTALDSRGGNQLNCSLNNHPEYTRHFVRANLVKRKDGYSFVLILNREYREHAGTPVGLQQTKLGEINVNPSKNRAGVSFNNNSQLADYLSDTPHGTKMTKEMVEEVDNCVDYIFEKHFCYDIDSVS